MYRYTISNVLAGWYYYWLLDLNLKKVLSKSMTTARAVHEDKSIVQNYVDGSCYVDYTGNT